MADADVTELAAIIVSPPVTNPAFAAGHGLPADTLFENYPDGSGYVPYGSPGSDYLDKQVFDERLVGEQNGEGGNELTLEERLKKKDKDKKKAVPTAPDPHPPELIPDTPEALAVYTSPDVVKVGDKPVPFAVHGKGSDDQNYSPDVKSNGKIIKRHDSKMTTTYGAEPGDAGVKSGTEGQKVEPVSSSPIVRANGIPVQRHSDTCTLNNGNCPGEYVHVKSTDTHEAPDGNDEQDKRPWYQRWNDAIWEFDRNNYNVVTRGLGGLQAIGGAVETAAGTTLATGGGVATATGVGAAPGIPAMVGGTALAVNGYDNFQAGLRQLWSGQSTPTMIALAAGGAATALGASPETAQTVQNTVGMAQGAAGAAGTIAATMKTSGNLAKITGSQGARSSALSKSGTYKELKKKLKGTDEQANHLNQDAAFRDKIPTNEGAANAMRGNAFKDVGTPHYNFHQSLEGFWDQYRKGGALFGQTPTVGQYDSALRNALTASGYSAGDASALANLAAANRLTYGLTNADLVPRIPGRINQSP